MTFDVFFMDFLIFFRKWRKCEINEEYNAKRGSEPSKSIDFCIVFSLNFHVFPNPSRRAFLEGPSADLGSKVRFWSDFRFSQGPKMTPWSDIFSQKVDIALPGGAGRSVLEPTWARPATQNGPRTHFHRFWLDFGSIWDGFGMIFVCVFNDF